MLDRRKDCVYVSANLKTRLPRLAQELQAVLEVNGVKYRELEGTRDIWMRDFMPVQKSDGQFVKFRYDPDYLNGYEDLKTPTERCLTTDTNGKVRFCDLALDGGNAVTASNKVIITDKVYKENPFRSRSQVREELSEVFQGMEVIIVPKRPYDVIGHSDGIVRFISDNKVFINDPTHQPPGYGAKLRKVLDRYDLEYAPFPYFCTGQVRDGIPTAVGNYINYLRTERLVVLPAYGRSEDHTARVAVETMIPEAKVVSLDCSDLALEGGVLNCITWTFRSN